MKIVTKVVATLMLSMVVICAAGCKKDPNNGGNSSGSYHGHQFVDLGLPSGTLWATCNVGATFPEGYGNYYAWGETHPKSIYDWDTYVYGYYDDNGDLHITKYNTDSSYGQVDNLTILQPTDDAATANWGVGWRTPTLEEWYELIAYTTSVYIPQRKGRLFTASNGNSLFLPAAGRLNDSSLPSVGYCGYYWSSSLGTNYSGNAWYLGFGSSNCSMVGFGDRACGAISVRAVLPASLN